MAPRRAEPDAAGTRTRPEQVPDGLPPDQNTSAEPRRTQENRRGCDAGCSESVLGPWRDRDVARPEELPVPARSPLDTLDEAFRALVAPPRPLAIDGRAIAGLP